MYKISKQLQSSNSKIIMEPYIGVIETEDNYYIISELAENLAEAKQRLAIFFKREKVRGVINIYKAKPKALSKIIDFHREQFRDDNRPLFNEMRDDVLKFLKKNCINVGVTFLAPFPPPEGAITDKFIEKVELRRS